MSLNIKVYIMDKNIYKALGSRIEEINLFIEEVYIKRIIYLEVITTSCWSFHKYFLVKSLLEVLNLNIEVLQVMLISCQKIYIA